MAVAAYAAYSAGKSKAREQQIKAVISASKQGQAAPATPPGIVLHHSYSSGWRNGKLVGVKELSEMHSETHPGWAITYEGKTYHIGYHYVILADGTVEKGRPDLCPGAHSRTHNNWLGICLVGNFATQTRFHFKPDRPTPEQRDSLISLCEQLMTEYHISPLMVKRHRDMNDTYCPGDNFPYQEIVRQLTDFADAHPEIYPTPPVIETVVKPPPLRSP